MRILVCGGRNFRDKKLLFDTLDTYIDKITLLVYGCAWGADWLAGEWAKQNNIPRDRYDAEWTLYGKPAGNIRNQRMLDEGKPDLVIAFPTGGPGTKDMMDITEEAGVPLIVIEKQL